MVNKQKQATKDKQIEHIGTHQNVAFGIDMQIIQLYAYASIVVLILNIMNYFNPFTFPFSINDLTVSLTES